MPKQSIVKLIIISLVVCCLNTGHTSAQDVKTKEPEILGADTGIDGNSCETTKALLDFAAISSGANSSIIIIAVHGRGESAVKINGRRLSQLRSYLEMTRGISKHRVITAAGEREGGLGRVKIYVGGELQVIFMMKRNKDFFTGCDS
ncbi:MAG TPA: hypothetical protein VEY11_11400 [Pyrinomonadaceae bacterium]|nr:hypothetical protein [Pyrinomonadaceae bacterium]